MKRLHILSALTITLLLCSCFTTREYVRPLTSGQVGHAEAGILFPKHVLDFTRGQFHTYDPEGLDVSMGYDLVNPTNLIAITVYVYPGPKLISIYSPADVIETTRRKLTDIHFQKVKAQVLDYHPETSLVLEQEITMQFQGQSLYGYSATFQSEEYFAHRVQPIISLAEVFAFDKWIIKFRITHPVKSKDQAKQAIEDFKKEFSKANEKDPDK